MNIPLISIIIPFYNERNRLADLLRSVNRLEASGFSYEVIFVNNNSSDEYLSEFSSYPRVRLVDAIGKASSYFARNCGAKHAFGKYLLFIDADVIPSATILECYRAYISNQPEGVHAVFAGDILPYHQESSHADISLFLAYAESRKILNQKSAATGWAFRPFAQTANCLMSLADFVSVGGFNENMTSGGDSEICWRLAQAHPNFQVVHCVDAYVRHIHRDDSISFAKQFTKYGRGRSEQILESEFFAENMKRQSHDNESSAILLDKILQQGISVGIDKEFLFLVIDYAKEMFFQTGYLRGLLRHASINPDLDYAELHKTLLKLCQNSGLLGQSSDKQP
ncbi:glycosyltransferase [Cyanobium gracile]|uniref:Glycosyltransferase n=1 Tax=Cyanobium gracile UHCC 0281 TaxID=3110309 RepID=A0ABU5SXP7_9CYAN|nr:glycosyltransferase [Cyanobium gracile]MEA5443274.1 glycosyltransferase [Cyanobium gracile UHCC 0281]